MFNNRHVVNKTCSAVMTDTEVYVFNRKTNVKTVYATSYKSQSVKVNCKVYAEICKDVTEESHMLAKNFTSQFIMRNNYERGKKVKYVTS